jgi:hypothetical protein
MVQRAEQDASAAQFSAKMSAYRKNNGRVAL